MQSDIDRLGAVLDRLTTSDRSFAVDLIHAARTKGLSPRQLPWVKTLLERGTAGPPPTVAINGKPIVDLLQKAAERLKHPKVLVASGDQALRLSIAGAQSRYPGSINVASTDKSFDDRQFFGRITADGTFHASARIDPATATAVAAALQALAENPAAAAKAYGTRFGHCCFCSLTLTDGPSIDAGYGPICADKYGLPWGGANQPLPINRRAAKAMKRRAGQADLVT